jgi:AcrR family transcriptional regulator
VEETKQAVDGRHLRSLQTRQKLLAAARLVFLHEGFQKATISQIIKRAHTGYGTAYVHFAGKDDLLIVLMEDVMAEFYAIAELPFRPATRSEAETMILRQTTMFLEMAESQRNMLRVFAEAIGISEAVRAKWTEIREKFIQRIAQDISFAQRRGLARAEVNSELVARSWFFSHEMYLWEIVREQHKAPLEEIAQTLVAIYTGGLYAQETPPGYS